MQIHDPLRGCPIWLRLSILAVTIGATFHEIFRDRSPHEPQQAIFVTLLITVALFVLSELLRPKPDIENARPSQNIDFPTATEGRPVPLVWGRNMLSGPNIVWYGDLTQDAITESVKTGLFSSTRITKGFKYNVGIQFALARGSGTGIVLKRVFIADIEVFTGTVSSDGATFDIDDSTLFGGNDLGTGGIETTCEFYSGSSTQTASAYLTTHQDVATGSAGKRTPAYLGTSYIVARGLNTVASGAYVGNQTSIKTWKFEVERFPATFSGQSAGENKISTTDCNPINVIFEILTNDEWGLGQHPSDIDVGTSSSFLSSADTMITEGNGFSMVVDQTMTAAALLKELQRQIDGVLFLDHKTGKWKIKLARDDYSIGSVPQFTDDNVREISDFTRGSWEDTTNFIRVKYKKRADNYKESFAVAQDVANAMIQGGGNVATAKATVGESSYPGVTDSTLASVLAWRDVRGQSYPLARATFKVSREFWDLTIGDVIAWTHASLGFTQLPMRITSIDYGKLQDNAMTVTTVQDVFQFAAASFGAPPGSGWTPPSVTLQAFPATEQLAFEAPRGLVARDPSFAGDITNSKVYASARRQTSEVAFEINERNASGTPSGAYALAGDVVQFHRIGELDTALGNGTAIPTAAITIVPSPDTQAILEASFDDTTTVADMGNNLVQLIMVGDEFMLVKSASDNGANVDLENVYRGALDSVQTEHADATDVYMLWLGGGITDTSFPNTNNVDIQLRMRSSIATFAGSVTTVAIALNKRALRPYPPAASLYNGGASAFGAPDLEGDGSTLNDFGFDVDWWRRDYTTTDEVASLLSDDTGVDASTEYRVRVFVDPDSANDEVHTSAWQTGTGAERVDRIDVVNKAAAGTEIRVQIEARHTFGGVANIISRYNLGHNVAPTSTLSSQFYLGGDLSASTGSNSYTTAATGTFTVTIGAAYTTSDVEYRLNGGAWTVVIAAAATTNTIAGVTSADTLEFRHTVNEAPTPNFLELQNPSATAVAYGVLTN